MIYKYKSSDIGEAPRLARGKGEIGSGGCGLQRSSVKVGSNILQRRTGGFLLPKIFGVGFGIGCLKKMVVGLQQVAVLGVASHFAVGAGL